MNPTTKTRILVARRDGYACMRCGRDLLNGYTDHSVHHRRLRSHPWPGLHEPQNLILLCGTGTTGCHGWVHAHPERSRELGYMVSMSEDRPETVPVYSMRHKWILLDAEGGWTPTDDPEADGGIRKEGDRAWR